MIKNTWIYISYATLIKKEPLHLKIDPAFSNNLRLKLGPHLRRLRSQFGRAGGWPPKCGRKILSGPVAGSTCSGDSLIANIPPDRTQSLLPIHRPADNATVPRCYRAGIRPVDPCVAIRSTSSRIYGSCDWTWSRHDNIRFLIYSNIVATIPWWQLWKRRRKYCGRRGSQAKNTYSVSTLERSSKETWNKCAGSYLESDLEIRPFSSI